MASFVFLTYHCHLINYSVRSLTKTYSKGLTLFEAKISIKCVSHQRVSEDLWTNHPHLACLVWAWWKCMEKKCNLDYLSEFPPYTHICQRACFDIKGPAVSFEGLVLMVVDSELSDFQHFDQRLNLKFAHFCTVHQFAGVVCFSEAAKKKFFK